MSLQNLGIVNDILSKAPTGSRSEENAYYKKAFEYLDSNKIGSAMKTLGKSGEDITNVLEAVSDGSELATAAIKKFGKETSASGGKLSGAFSGLKLLGSKALTLLANPLTWVALAAGATALVAYENSFGRLSEKAEESKTTFQKTSSELESMKSQFESNQNTIDEIRTSDDSSRSQTLADLEKENILLAAQIKLKEQIAADDKAKAAEDANKALTTKSLGKVAEFGGTFGTSLYGDAIDKLKWQQDSLAQLESDYADQLAYIKKLEKQGYNSEGYAYKNAVAQAELLKEKIDSLNGSITESEAAIIALWASIAGNEKYSDTENRILQLLPDIAKEPQGLSDEMQGIVDQYNAFVEGSNLSTDTKEGLTSRFLNWIKGLSPDEQEILKGIEGQADWTLANWQAALAKAMGGAEAKADSDFKLTVSAEQEGLNTVTAAIEKATH